jgi:aryl-alcohol dehydrogenase-like predicted oxidoreductase
MYNGAMFRLAEYSESRDYYKYLNELMNISSNSDILKPLYNLLEELDESKHKFGWIGDYDSFLFMQILPHIQRVLEKLDDENRESILSFIDIFLQEYRKMVAYESSKTTKILLKEILKDTTKSIQEIAIEFLLKESSIDVVLVGMRKATYVDEIVAIRA